MKALTLLAVVLMLMPLSAHAIEVEEGVTPDQREQLRLRLTNRNPERPAVLMRLTGAAVGHGSEGSFVLSTWEQVCDLPCTVRVTAGSEVLNVGGRGWSAPLRLDRYDGTEIDLEVRPGRPGAYLAGLITSSLFGTVAFIGGSFLLIHHLVASDGDGLGPGLIRTGQTMTFGGLAGTALGVGLMVHGNSWVRQRR